MTSENLQGIIIKGGNADVHGNTFNYGGKPPSLILAQQPPNVDRFVGREAELAEIQTWLHDSQVRLVGLTAAGGYGKTFLAAQVLRLMLPEAKHLWLSFDQPYSFSQTGRWLLQQFGVELDERMSTDDVAAAMVDRLSKEPCVLVLDNLETLLDEFGKWQEPAYEAFFWRWLSHGNQSVILLTSRESFAIPENRQEYVRWQSLQGLASAEGVALLQQAKIQGEVAKLEKLVMLAGGHPLLLNLTIGWLKNRRRHLLPDVTYALKLEDLDRLDQIVGEHRGDPKASSLQRKFTPPF